MSTTEVPDTAQSREWVPRLGPLGQTIDARTQRLQQSIGTSGSTAMLAHLRSSIAKEPGSVPDIWELTIADLPGWIRGDAPTPEERAAHTALTLYALHQQSRADPMHRRGPGLGQAVRQLAAGETSGAVRRRFDAVATATSFAEVAHHLRSVISRLRTASAPIPLDYGQLADDLLQWQRPGGPDIVRRRWGRQFYRTTDTSDTSDAQQADPADE